MALVKRSATATFAALVTLMLASAIFASPAWAQELSVIKEQFPGDETVTVGDELTYTITVSNTEATTAQDVVLTDPLPDNTTFVSAEVVGPPTEECDGPAVGASNGTIVCELGDIGAVPVVVTLTVRPTAAAGEEGSVRNTATADGDNTTPDSDPETTTVEPLDLTIEKNGVPDPVDVGELLLYTLEITNNIGTQDVEVRDRLPDEVNVVDVDIDVDGPGEGNCTESDNVVECTIDDLPDGGNDSTATIEILVRALQEATPTNTARVFFQGNQSDRSTPIAEDRETTVIKDNNPNPNPSPPSPRPPRPNPPFPPNDPIFNDPGDNDQYIDESTTDGTSTNDTSTNDTATDDQYTNDDTTDDTSTDDGTATDDQYTDDGVTAGADGDGATATTPGATATAADDQYADPDAEAPVGDPLGDIVDEVPDTGEALPPTGGREWLPGTGGAFALAAPLGLALVAGGALVLRYGARRR